MKPSELPGARHLYRLTNRALAQIKELWQYAGEDEVPPDSLLQAQFEVVRILQIDVPLSAKRQFQLFCSEHFPGLADILDCLAADQLWALLSMGVQLADSDQPHAQSAAVRFGGPRSPLRPRRIRRSPRRSPIARRWIRPLARGSPKAHRPFLGRDPPRLDAGHRLQLGKEPHISEHKESDVGCSELEQSDTMQEERSRFSPGEDTIKSYEL